MTSTKRIQQEIRAFEKKADNYNNVEGIYIHYDDSDLTKLKVMLIGRSETPYEHGFHFFDLQFPSNYPFVSPTVQYKTGDGKTRMNPNLYVNGKVCLSILGTWHGPEWVATMQFSTVFMSIQSMVLNKDPIRNEPAHENATAAFVSHHRQFIHHENLRIAFINQLKNTPTNFTCFKEQMIQYAKTNQAKIEAMLTEKLTTDGTELSGQEHEKIKTNYKQLLADFREIMCVN